MLSADNGWGPYRQRLKQGIVEASAEKSKGLPMISESATISLDDQPFEVCPKDVNRICQLLPNDNLVEIESRVLIGLGLSLALTISAWMHCR